MASSASVSKGAATRHRLGRIGVDNTTHFLRWKTRIWFLSSSLGLRVHHWPGSVLEHECQI